MDTKNENETKIDENENLRKIISEEIAKAFETNNNNYNKILQDIYKGNEQPEVKKEVKFVSKYNKQNK